MFAPLVLASGIGTPPQTEPVSGLDMSRETYLEFNIDTHITYLSSEYGLNENLVRRIIQCESGFVKDAIGTKAVVGKDIGLFQLNTYYHKNTMLSRGMDIYDPKDNLEYGFMLLNKEGVKPWEASSKCWRLDN